MASGGHQYGTYCCVPWCLQSSKVYPREVLGPGVHFFRISRKNGCVWALYYLHFSPLVPLSHCKQLVYCSLNHSCRSMRGWPTPDVISQLHSPYRICTKHFTAQDFMDPARMRLTKMAVPTVLRVSQGNAVEDLDFMVSGVGQY
ncbi:uncharacterized protein LOC144155192 [Haemaphysalis longicornis]